MNVSVLNLGAGVQSTTIYLMACENRRIIQNRLAPPPPQFEPLPVHLPVEQYLPYPAVGLVDFAIFADTQDEPDDYHLDARYAQVYACFDRGALCLNLALCPLLKKQKSFPHLNHCYVNGGLRGGERSVSQPPVSKVLRDYTTQLYGCLISPGGRIKQ